MLMKSLVRMNKYAGLIENIDHQSNNLKDGRAEKQNLTTK